MGGGEGEHRKKLMAEGKPICFVCIIQASMDMQTHILLRTSVTVSVKQ